ncbi:alpha/beta fold hydrolase [Phytoactinopolyspora mesophila]|uniref:Alpha/beta fold hydrolase n=1 Tax=Phytoactinopolyspora mesophila TaxID=2650750 RepID=A0A7K3M7L0_9ACTN|nr:alpha/beta fold hydrolase [Phytoactinopolyspora mesophila]NDL59254.1 alpha/beta fold hydrolase [Phytoactinopolyspora mesophila]
MASIEINGSHLAYDEAGAGSTVIFIHAGVADRRMWDHQFTALSATHHVIRYDWRGYGESGEPHGEVAHHEDVLAQMDALGIEQAALVGSSYGGAYAVDTALAAPDRITALTLICAGLSGHVWPQGMLELARQRVHNAVPADRLERYQAGTAAHVDPADVQAMAEAQVDFMVVGPDRDVRDFPARTREKAIEMCRGVFLRTWSRSVPLAQRWIDPPAITRLAEISAPTLVVNGLADVSYIQAVSDLLADGITGSTRVDLPDTGHLPPLERPAEVTRLLIEHLERPLRLP